MKRRAGIIRRDLKRIFRRPAVRRAAAAILFITVLLAIRWYNVLLNGRVETPALYAAETAAGIAVDRAAESVLGGVDDQIIVDSPGGGYKVDAAALSALRETFTETLADILDGQSVIKTRVPLGSLTGNQFLSGKGPRVTAKTYARYMISCETDSSFRSEGINQTMFSVTLRVSVECSLLFPEGEKSTVVSDEIILAQRLIPGEVPLAGGS